MLETEAARKDKPGSRRKWAKAAGDHETLSARGNEATGRYIEDLNTETAESIRFKPAPSEDSRISSVKPSCCARRDELPRLAGQVQLTTGKAEIGYDEKKKDMVFSFVRHENDEQGREVLENRARVRTLHDKDRFRSNDGSFSTGAMEMRCEAARSTKTVMRRFGSMSAREGGETTMDRVAPFQRVDRERDRVRQLNALEHGARSDRSSIHSAATAAAVLAAKKEQRQMDFKKKFAKITERARQHTKSDDYQLYIKRKWEMMRGEGMPETLPGTAGSEDALSHAQPDEGRQDEQ